MGYGYEEGKLLKVKHIYDNEYQKRDVIVTGLKLYLLMYSTVFYFKLICSNFSFLFFKAAYRIYVLIRSIRKFYTFKLNFRVSDTQIINNLQVSNVWDAVKEM